MYIIFKNGYIIRLKIKYRKNHQRLNTDNVLTFKFDSRSIASNIWANNTRLKLLGIHIGILCVRRRHHMRVRHPLE